MVKEESRVLSTCVTNNFGVEVDGFCADYGFLNTSDFLREAIRRAMADGSYVRLLKPLNPENHKTLFEIWTNPELKGYEREGFVHGQEKDKSMAKVTIFELSASLDKQWQDYKVIINPSNKYPVQYKLERINDIKQKLADLRNVAACIFIKLQSLELSLKMSEAADNYGKQKG
jgi:hypothetical protein